MWLRVSGLQNDTEYNNVVGCEQGDRENDTVALRINMDSCILVPKRNTSRVAWSALPATLKFDERQRKSVRKSGSPRFVQFFDSDGDDIVFEGWEKDGSCRYSVNGSWRPPCSVVEFYCKGRSDIMKTPHMRLTCGSRFKNIPLDTKDLDTIIDKMTKLCRFAQVAYNECDRVNNSQLFKPGDAVTLQKPIYFKEGDNLIQGTRAVVLQETTSADVEVCVASGDRIDVPIVNLRPAKTFFPGTKVFLKREAVLSSGKIPEGTLLTVKKRADKGNIEVSSDEGTVFEVSGLWLRDLDGNLVT
ncbi:hypothetical protein DIPPA_32257 [Diplonema papillatum]|nr:hypothetical protein DIPPA_32257 [Diplonema papillatum]